MKISQPNRTALISACIFLSCAGTTFCQDPFPLGPEIPLASGIVNDCDGPFHSGDVIINNCWQGLQNNITTVVYGGALAANTQQGVIIVTTIPPYPATTTQTRVLTPFQAGSVH